MLSSVKLVLSPFLILPHKIPVLWGSKLIGILLTLIEGSGNPAIVEIDSCHTVLTHPGETVSVFLYCA